MLYPFTLRDTLLRAAAAGHFQARWSDKILDETTHNLVADHIVTLEQAARLRAAMTAAFPEARVIASHKLVATMKNDPKDRHVVAAAVKANAQVIVTLNIRDFRPLPEGIEAQTPDRFLAGLLDKDPRSVVDIVREQSAALRSPPRSFEEVTGALARVVPGFARRVRGYSPE